MSSVRMTSWAVVSNLLPNSPPGWNCAKSRGWKFRFSISATARASPMAICAIVELVGARFSGQASFSTPTFRKQVEYLANSDSGLPLMPIIGICMCSTMGMNRSSSSVCPELEMASTTSSGVITPRSPWNTSRGLMKNEGVPVEESVAAIFAPMCPLLPTPVTMTLPLHSYISETAFSKLSSSLPISPSTASASSLKHCMANSFAVIRYSLFTIH